MKIYYFVDFNNSNYCCTFFNGKILKANFKDGEQSDYRFESDYEVDFFNKFNSESDYEIEYIPNENQNFEPDNEPEYDPDEDPDIDAYEISDFNEEIEKIINKPKCINYE